MGTDLETGHQGFRCAGWGTEVFRLLWLDQRQVVRGAIMNKEGLDSTLGTSTERGAIKVTAREHTSNEDISRAEEDLTYERRT